MGTLFQPKNGNKTLAAIYISSPVRTAKSLYLHNDKTLSHRLVVKAEPSRPGSRTFIHCRGVTYRQPLIKTNNCHCFCFLKKRDNFASIIGYFVWK